MKPIVSSFQAWGCIVISVFAVLILTVLGALFKSGHHALVGSTEDPKDGGAVAGTCFAAVFVYLAFIVFCGLQALLHMRENRRGAIRIS